MNSICSSTLEEKGTKEVSVRSTEHEKMRITILLAGRSDG